MKTVKTIAMGLALGFLAVPMMSQAAKAANVESSLYAEADLSELKRSSDALQTNARAWLAFLQDLPVPQGQKDTFDDAIRAARFFQLDAIKAGDLIDQGKFDEAITVLDNEMATDYAAVSRSYRSILRLFYRDTQYRRPLQDKFGALRTTYFYTGQLLSEAIGM